MANKAYKRKVFEDDWYLSETFDAAIGQGFNLATCRRWRLCSVKSPMAGVRYKPYLVQAIMKPDGTVLEKFSAGSSQKT